MISPAIPIRAQITTRSPLYFKKLRRLPSLSVASPTNEKPSTDHKHKRRCMHDRTRVSVCFTGNELMNTKPASVTAESPAIFATDKLFLHAKYADRIGNTINPIFRV